MNSMILDAPINDIIVVTILAILFWGALIFFIVIMAKNDEPSLLAFLSVFIVAALLSWNRFAFHNVITYLIWNDREIISITKTNNSDTAYRIEYQNSSDGLIGVVNLTYPQIKYEYKEESNQIYYHPLDDAIILPYMAVPIFQTKDEENYTINIYKLTPTADGKEIRITYSREGEYLQENVLFYVNYTKDNEKIGLNTRFKKAVLPYSFMN